MNNVSFKKHIIFFVLISFFYTYKVQANSMEGLSVKKESFEISENHELGYSYVYKNGKWKKFWKEFAIGFLEEIMTPAAPPNDNDEDFSYSELKDIDVFAKKVLGSKEAAMEFAFNLDELIHSENQYINEEDFAKVFKNDNSLMVLIRRIVSGKSKANPNKPSPRVTDRIIKKGDAKVQQKSMRIDRGDKINVDKEKSVSIGRLLGKLAAKIIKHFL